LRNELEQTISSSKKLSKEVKQLLTDAKKVSNLERQITFDKQNISNTELERLRSHPPHHETNLITSKKEIDVLNLRPKELESILSSKMIL
jgi:hypothetical protein